jgi:beta-N-acetylhexosaminidase
MPAQPALPIAIDHEGGRVQRCREGFTRVPPMRRLGELWDRDPQAAQGARRQWLCARRRTARLRRRSVVYPGARSRLGPQQRHRRSLVPRDRPRSVELAGALIEGLRSAGMAACGKHSPGHGWVAADSHVDLPVDERSLAELAPDLEPYRRLRLDGVMPAHVIYRAGRPAAGGLLAGLDRKCCGGSRASTA